MNIIDKKIYIVGSAGSGKTTLAGLLCQRLGFMHYDLDDIAYPNQKVQLMEKRLKAITELAEKNQWVAEGVYVSWVGDLLKSADKIIWLDLPLWLTLFRIIKRFLVSKLTGRDPHGFKAFLRLTRGLIHYHFPKPSYESDKLGEYITQEKIKKALEPYQNKVLRITNSQSLEKFVNSLTDSSF